MYICMHVCMYSWRLGGDRNLCTLGDWGVIVITLMWLCSKLWMFGCSKGSNMCL